MHCPLRSSLMVHLEWWGETWFCNASSESISDGSGELPGKIIVLASEEALEQAPGPGSVLINSSKVGTRLMGGVRDGEVPDMTTALSPDGCLASWLCSWSLCMGTLNSGGGEGEVLSMVMVLSPDVDPASSRVLSF